MERLELLRNNTLFSALDDAQLTSLGRLFTERKITANTVIFQQGDSADALYLLLDGQVKVMLTGEDGKEVIIAILNRGDSFGEMALLDADGRSAQVMSMSPCRLLALSAADFRDWIAGNPKLAMAIIQQLSGRLRQANQTINSLATLDVKSRVARVLLEHSVQQRPQESICDLPSQAVIAKMVGASRERVNRALKALQADGLLILERGRPRLHQVHE